MGNLIGWWLKLKLMT